MIDLFAAVGSDRYLSLDEIRRSAPEHRPLAMLWEVYQRGFDGFCESRLDPMHHRLAHPAQHVGALAIDSSESILVVGTGPSTPGAMSTLHSIRSRVRILTSPRGAELLADHGVLPDLIVIEHRTALDAHHSARHVRDRSLDVLCAAPLIAADWRTPSTLLDAIPPDRLFVPDPLPTWGLWPATAVALARAGGARRIGLLGIDLGCRTNPKPEFVPLINLLSVLAQLCSCETFDCGTGVVKSGWPRSSLEDFARATVSGKLTLHKRRGPAVAERHRDASRASARLTPAVNRARQILATALAARAGRIDRAALREGALEMLAWRDHGTHRIDIQESLGATFLPRLWRSGIDLELDAALWRPVALAAHEIVGQAASLRRCIARAAA